VTDEQDEDGFVYLGVDDALEIYAAILGLTTVQAADPLRSREALDRAAGRARRLTGCALHVTLGYVLGS
jgi:hypothetical protein